MPWTETVTATLPGTHVEAIRAIVAAGHARSVSAWIATAVAEHLATEGASPPAASRSRTAAHQATESAE